MIFPHWGSAIMQVGTSLRSYTKPLQRNLLRKIRDTIIMGLAQFLIEKHVEESNLSSHECRKTRSQSSIQALYSIIVTR